MEHEHSNLNLERVDLPICLFIDMEALELPAYHISSLYLYTSPELYNEPLQMNWLKTLANDYLDPLEIWLELLGKSGKPQDSLIEHPFWVHKVESSMLLLHQWLAWIVWIPGFLPFRFAAFDLLHWPNWTRRIAYYFYYN